MAVQNPRLNLQEQTVDMEPPVKRWKKEVEDLCRMALRAGAKEREIVERMQEIKLYDFVRLGALYDEYRARVDATR